MKNETEDSGPSPRRVANAVRHLSTERRQELYTEFTGRPVPRTATIGAVATVVAHSLVAKGIPDDVQALMKPYKRRNSEGGSGPKMGVATIFRDLLREGQPVTGDALIAAVKEKGLDIEQQRPFQRGGIKRLMKVMTKRVAKMGVVAEYSDETGVACLTKKSGGEASSPADAKPKTETKPNGKGGDGKKPKESAAKKAAPKKGATKPKRTAKKAAPKKGATASAAAAS